MRTWYFIGFLSILSCESFWKDNPEFCSENTPCADGRTCDLAHHQCGSLPSGAAVTGISPPFGSPDGMTLITLQGQNFVDGMTVHLNGGAVATTFKSATELQFMQPKAGACGQVLTVTAKTPDSQLVTGSQLLRYKYLTLAMAPTPTVQVIPGARAVAAGLLDSDKFTDLVVAGTGPALQQLTGNGSLNFAISAPPLMNTGTYTDVLISDLDKNNITDIVARYSGAIDVCQGTATNPYVCSITTNNRKSSLNNSFVISDINKDGSQDIIAMSNTNVLSTYLAGPSLVYGGVNFAHTFFEFMGPSNGMVAGDFNKDGNPDIAIAHPTNQRIFILQGSGDGSFANQATAFPAPQPSQPQPPVLLATLDADQDGRDDLIIATDAPSTSSLILARSSGPDFVLTSIASISPMPQLLLTEDLDCDGLKDIILYNSGDSQISVYLNTGNGGFLATPKLFTLTDKILSLAVANLTASDFKPDIAVIGQTGPTLATYQNLSN